jgi:hypothetical protein
MSSQPIIPGEFDINKVSFSKCRTLDNGGKVVYIQYNNAPLIFQTPEMYAPFGVSKWDNDKGGNKYTLDLSFKGIENREILKKFHADLIALDAKLLQVAKENSVDWFKKQQSDIVLKELMTPIIRNSKDNKFPPTFKATLPKKNDLFDFEVYNKSKELVTLDTVELKGALVSILGQSLGVWIAGSKFGFSFKTIQMMVSPVKKFQGYNFKTLEESVPEPEEDDDDDDDTNANEVLDNAVVKSNNESEVDESDDELEPAAPVAAAAAPSAPVKAGRKPVVKK